MRKLELENYFRNHVLSREYKTMLPRCAVVSSFLSARFLNAFSRKLKFEKLESFSITNRKRKRTLNLRVSSKVKHNNAILELNGSGYGVE